ncbi:MAG: penicillin-binding transpeptidase domain-containing protein [Microthrixaceae bacterium]
MDDTPRLRLSILGIVCISLFASLTARLWYLQVLNREEFAAEGQQSQLRTVHEQGPRGRILDVKGRVLVDNRLSVVVGIVRDEVDDLNSQERSELYGALADKFNSYDIEALKRADIEDQVNDPRYAQFDFIPLYQDAPPELELFFAEHREDYPGIRVRRETIRTYPYGHIGASILGYVGHIDEQEYADPDIRQAAADEGKPYSKEDDIGKGGVEQSMEAQLRGTPGSTTVEVSRTGAVVQVREETPPKVGADVWLTIDIDAQAWAEHVLKEHMSDVRGHRDKDGRIYRAPEGASAIVNPHNGEIIALASVPTYDPSALVGGISTDVWEELNDPASGSPLNNWAVSGQFPPGSTFKLVTLYAALENGLFAPGQPPGLEDSTGKYTIADCGGGPSCVRQNAGGVALGYSDPQSSLTISSDVFYYWLGDRMWRGKELLGETPIQDAGAKFGLGTKTGIPLAGEAGGRMPTPDMWRKRFDEAEKRLEPGEENPWGRRNWTAGDSVNLSIGQGEALVTPLQLANAYATIGNGGTHNKPLLVSKVTVPTDATKAPTAPDNPPLATETFLPVVQDRLPFTENHLAVMQAGFEGVIHNGRGTANDMWSDYGGLPGRWAGKTGTSEAGTDANPKADGSVFALYGPVDAPFGPNFAIATIIPESGFGADTSGPTAVRTLRPLVEGNLPPAPKVGEDRDLPPVPPLDVKP